LCIATQPHDIVHKILIQCNLPLDLISLENENTRITTEGGPTYQFLPILRSIGRSLQSLLNKTENVQLQDYIELTEGWDLYQQKLVQLSTTDAELKMRNEALKSSSKGFRPASLRDSFETNYAQQDPPVGEQSLDELLADMNIPENPLDLPPAPDPPTEDF